MSFELTQCKLKEVLEVVIDNRGKNPNAYAEYGIPVIDNYLITSNGEINLNEVNRFIDEDTYNSFLRKHLEPNDVLVTLVGNGYGKVAITPKKKCAIIQNTIGLRCNKENSNQFLYYLLRNNRELLMNLNRGAAQPSIKAGDLLDLEFLFPPLNTQKNIARTLGALDNKIHLNTQTNQTLESIAQAIFKSWFVDFEPVKAKMAALESGGTREQAELAAMSVISGKSEAELAQLQQQNPEHYQQLTETAVLFPSAMVESELGEIPEGWEVKSISDISTFPNGKVDTSVLSLSNYISTENMLENRGGVSDAASLPSTNTVPQFSPDQILISNIRPYFKKIWLARFSGGRSNDVLAFSAKESGNAEFLYNLLYQDSFFEFMTRTSKGAKMPRGDKNAISNWKFACAPIILRIYFSKEVRSLYSKIQNANNQNIELAELRDFLLPKLLSGELTTPLNKGI